MTQPSAPWVVRILEKPEEMEAVEALQRVVWAGSETDVIPLHMLVTAAHNGGLLIGAFDETQRLAGFVFGFPGLYFTPDGPRPKHCSHELAVHPDFRNRGLGFILKRAQWQMVRHQGIDLITWTFDPLLSLNAFLNITRLGSVCHTYLQDFYGAMRDGMNVGLPSDRFQVDWWVNTRRVQRRLSKRPRPQIKLEHVLSAGARIVNPAVFEAEGLPLPHMEPPEPANSGENIVLLEIPADFPAVKARHPTAALDWRLSFRSQAEKLFSEGYLVTDFVHDPGPPARSFYVLSHGESTF